MKKESLTEVEKKHYFFRDSKYPHYRQEIANLAEKILSSIQLSEAQKYTQFYTAACEREVMASDENELIFAKDAQGFVTFSLAGLVGISPKRPLYYLAECIQRLPRDARIVVKFSGDYLDQLIKHFFDEADMEYRNTVGKSLGSNLARVSITQKLPPELLDQLKEFNRILYIPAKHEFEYEKKEHIFTPQEAMLACFIMHHLSEKITLISSGAQKYAAKIDENYHLSDPGEGNNW